MFERKRHLKEVIETKSKQIANRDKLIEDKEQKYINVKKKIRHYITKTKT